MKLVTFTEGTFKWLFCAVLVANNLGCFRDIDRKLTIQSFRLKSRAYRGVFRT